MTNNRPRRKSNKKKRKSGKKKKLRRLRSNR